MIIRTELVRGVRPILYSAQYLDRCNRDSLHGGQHLNAGERCCKSIDPAVALQCARFNQGAHAFLEVQTGCPRFG
jgi:hypothetical protein